MEPIVMNIDNDMSDDEPTECHKAIKPQPAEPQMEMEATQEFLRPHALPTIPFARGVPTVPLQPTEMPTTPHAPVSRRKFMGVSVAGLAAIGGAGTAAAVSGVALAKLIQNGLLGDASHGPMAS